MDLHDNLSLILNLSPIAFEYFDVSIDSSNIISPIKVKTKVKFIDLPLITVIFLVSKPVFNLVSVIKIMYHSIQIFLTFIKLVI
jgi:hypothetical protein